MVRFKVPGPPDNPYRTSTGELEAELEAAKKDASELRASLTRSSQEYSELQSQVNRGKDKFLAHAAVTTASIVGGLAILIGSYVWVTGIHSEAWHSAAVACVPGDVAKMDGSYIRLYRVWDRRVVCTDGTKRWVTTR